MSTDRCHSDNVVLQFCIELFLAFTTYSLQAAGRIWMVRHMVFDVSQDFEDRLD